MPFNVVWLLAFAVPAWAVHRRWNGALAIVWFFVAVADANGVLHVAVTVLQARYLAGVVTAPILFLIGVMLLRRLIEGTVGPRPT